MNKTMNIKHIVRFTQEIRKDILKYHAKTGRSHVGSSLSCVDILIALYFGVLNITPGRAQMKQRDIFILSKGHAVSALYAVLTKKGFMSKDLFWHCLLPGHSTKDCVPGIEVSTGALGHGLPIGVGYALAARFDKSRSRVFVLMSDGECNEGSVWEAAMFAGHNRLDHLVAIIDYNKIQALGRTQDVLDLEPLRDKWASFGWEVKEMDGHDVKKMIRVLKEVPLKKNKPSVFIMHTIKGKGVSFMEDKVEWHYRSPNEELLKTALKELSAP
jgi:transketolase